jgi:hypothetical protein
MIIRPPAVEPDSQLQLRLCRWGLRASLGREVQLERYFVLGLKLLYLGYPAVTHPEVLERLTKNVESRRWARLYGILSGPCMI